MKRLFATASIAAAVCAVAAAAARADQETAPWQGGSAVVTPFEAHASNIASEIAERRVSVQCNDDLGWSALGAQLGFDPRSVWGFVLFRVNRLTGRIGPDDTTQIAPFACTYLDDFWGAADKTTQKMCRTGTRIEYRTEARTEYRSVTKTVRKRVKVKGKWTWRRVKVTQRVPVQVQVQVAVEVPVQEVCSDWDKKLFGVETLSHESVHLYGIDDEAVAECFGLQTLAWVAWKLGATPAFAVEAAKDYAAMYDELWGGTEYYSPECRDGGQLDLAPAQQGWPAPSASPLAVPNARAMRSVARRATAPASPAPDAIVVRSR